MLVLTLLLASHDFIAHVTRLGGDTASAQPTIDKFCRYLEAKMGWPQNSVDGKFYPSKVEATKHIETDKPSFGMLEPALYVELKEAKKVEPIVNVESKELTWKKLYLVSKGGASLEALKGKTLCAVGADSPKYLSKYVFAGQIDAAKHFQLKPVAQPLKALRAVLNGECDATLLDEQALAAAAKLEGGAELKPSYTSPPLPPLPIVAFGTSASSAEKKKLADILLAMCDDGEGKAVCQEMRIEKFVPTK